MALARVVGEVWADLERMILRGSGGDLGIQGGSWEDPKRSIYTTPDQPPLAAVMLI